MSNKKKQQENVDFLDELIEYCYKKCEEMECINCIGNGKFSIPFCKILLMSNDYLIIDTKTLSSDVAEILINIQQDFYKEGRLAHSIAIIEELIKNKRYIITKKGDDEKL